MINRVAKKTLIRLSKQFKAVAVIGPRQSGKTTLVKATFTNKDYVNLENPDTRQFLKEDPRGFLAQYSKKGAIFDEAQRVPELFSYLQEILDDTNKFGHFILTGSNNFLLQQNISQSLAGRIGYLTLLPFSIAELKIIPKNSEELIYKGFYPSLYNKKNIETNLWFSNYIRTYVERDVRQIKTINNLYTFEKFLKLCAGRVGQLLNKNSLAVEVGVDSKTIESWIGILEASFIVFRLQPYHKNFNKRVVKMAKLYFYDTGLACALLGVQNSDQLQFHPFKGSLFENLVILDILKQKLNNGDVNNLYFWRNKTGHEIDLIIDSFNNTIPIEIKAGKTITNDYFKGLNYWNKLTKNNKGLVVYGGDNNQKRSNGTEIISYKNIKPYL